jgi:hypothetical protein
MKTIDKILAEAAENVTREKAAIKARRLAVYVIGIDPGVNTGFAVWNRTEKKLTRCDSLMIHEAMRVIESMNNAPYPIFVRVEDARLNVLPAKLRKLHREQGAGSIKRDSQIWEDFLTDMDIPFEMTDPRKPPKIAGKKGKDMDSAEFQRLTGWQGRTNEHARDAAMLCWQA